ncbi:MAG: hypothetical protein RL376_1676 [Verrucomicrobiota bacterium]
MKPYLVNSLLRRVVFIFVVTFLSCRLGAQSSEGAKVYLDQLDLGKAQQSFGKPGYNRSAGDTPVKLGGETFAHAFGTHAYGVLAVDLKKSTKRFNALVGVDDGVEKRGSVQFYVYGDGKELAKTPILNGCDVPMPLSVDTTNVGILTLVVDDAGNGYGHDHANWADAYFVLSSPNAPKLQTIAPYLAPSLEKVYLDQLDLTNATQGYAETRSGVAASGSRISIDGTTYNHAVGTHSNGMIVVELNGIATQFKSTVGVDDNANEDGSVRFTLIGDGVVLAKTDVMYKQDKPRALNANISGVKQLVLKVDDGGDGISNDHAVWAEPLFIIKPGSKTSPRTVPASQAVLPR